MEMSPPGWLHALEHRRADQRVREPDVCPIGQGHEEMRLFGTRSIGDEGSLVPLRDRRTERERRLMADGGSTARNRWVSSQVVGVAGQLPGAGDGARPSRAGRRVATFRRPDAARSSLRATKEFAEEKGIALRASLQPGDQPFGVRMREIVARGDQRPHGIVFEATLSIRVAAASRTNAGISAYSGWRGVSSSAR